MYSNHMSSKYGQDAGLSFGAWAAFSCPISFIMLVATWAWLLFCFLGRDAFRFTSQDKYNIFHVYLSRILIRWHVITLIMIIKTCLEPYGHLNCVLRARRPDCFSSCATSIHRSDQSSRPCYEAITLFYTTLLCFESREALISLWKLSDWWGFRISVAVFFDACDS